MFPEMWTCSVAPEVGNLLCRQGWPGTCCDSLLAASRCLDYSHVPLSPTGLLSNASHGTVRNDPVGRCEASGVAEELELSVMSPAFPGNWWHHSTRHVPCWRHSWSEQWALGSSGCWQKRCLQAASAPRYAADPGAGGPPLWDFSLQWGKWVTWINYILRIEWETGNILPLVDLLDIIFNLTKSTVELKAQSSLFFVTFRAHIDL